jgi:hydroxyacid-oxoacid transhydrogenase
MTMPAETAFTIDTSSIKYGVGVTKEVGYEVTRMGAKRVMVVTDPKLTNSDPVATVMESLRAAGVDAVLFDQVSVEPTDLSMKQAIAFATEGNFDGYIAVGGGSSIDTAKTANLYATYPADFLAYVNAPIGEGRLVPGPLKPLIAIPTTTGTGSETTGVAIFDFLEMKAKTGIAHRALRPDMGLIDPENTRSLPGMVVACSGFDVLSHALESFTALPFSQRAAPEHPGARPSYQGSNPISDIWALKAAAMGAKYIVRASQDPTDHEARGQMLLAATYAGIGFGNAGCHVPHGMSYAVSGMVKEFVAEGYPVNHPLVPHGMSVILNAPAVFRFTAPTNPRRHLQIAEVMGADIAGASDDDAGEILSGLLTKLIQTLKLPNGLGAVGYEPDDVTDLTTGTMPQQRVLRISPRPVHDSDIRQLFLDSLTLW